MRAPRLIAPIAAACLWAAVAFGACDDSAEISGISDLGNDGQCTYVCGEVQVPCTESCEAWAGDAAYLDAGDDAAADAGPDDR